VDGSDEAPGPDAGDAGPLEGGVADASCDGGPLTFCDDFARATSDLQGGWTKLELQSGATAVIEPAGAVGQLVVNLPAATFRVYLERAFNAEARHFVYELDVTYDALPTAGAYVIAKTDVYNGDRFALTYVYAASDGLYFVEQLVGSDYRRERIATAGGGRRRVTVDFAIRGDRRVLIDGRDAIPRQPTANYLSAGAPRLTVGLNHIEDPAPGWSVRLERVRFFAE
jgi:hypothetical protein